MNPPSQPGACPPPSAWLLAAAGQAPDLRRHASSCGACAALLREAERLSSDKLTPQEAAALEGLSVMDDDAPSLLARRLTQSEPPPPRRAPRLAWAGFALAATAAAAGAWFFLLPKTSSPEQLLARADALNRPSEFRLPGMDYAPLSQTRASSGPKAPSELARAEVAVDDARAHSSAPLWRAHLAFDRREFDRGIRDLEPLLRTRPSDAATLSTLGALYAAYAEAENLAAPSERALELVSRALALNPALPEALFNQALLLERLGNLSQAEASWRRYLALDPSSPWATEARSHLSSIASKKN